MGKNHCREITRETGSEYPGTLGIVANDGVFRLDAVPPDGKN
jgi:hypothetical protein